MYIIHYFRDIRQNWNFIILSIDIITVHYHLIVVFQIGLKLKIIIHKKLFQNRVGSFSEVTHLPLMKSSVHFNFPKYDISINHFPRILKSVSNIHWRSTKPNRPKKPVTIPSKHLLRHNWRIIVDLVSFFPLLFSFLLFRLESQP